MIKRLIVRRRGRAFSLIETTLAIGLLSFALIAVMGLIPVVLQTSRSAIDRSIELRMLQSVQTHLVNLPYSGLPPNGSYYFNAEGVEITEENREEVQYQVDFTNHESTFLPAGQTSSRLTTSVLLIRNTATQQIQTNSLHLPDNGF